MTLFSACHATKVLGLAIALATSGMTAAQAGGNKDGFGWSQPNIDGGSITRRDRDRHHRESWRHRDREDRGSRYAERRREHRGWRDGNFYGGAITAYRDRGNGTYFYIDGNDDYAEVIDAPRFSRGGPKVIHVVPGQDGCSWEMGVCVVRPSY
ncbi:hypothetical protein MUO32_21955 [Shinella sp. CPCC 101442]|uniref:hypothetical protein n=1 Tax=Shinella sp. CPCC 101442 TaxID=2932265 RepID=UPI0021537AFC|nr:hypothetical protein [Shinella sp. CPCC 101442]MCR6501709.1 hypothetical protein [Shinella sp. CPCC 101442]